MDDGLMLEGALRLARIGFAVFPLHPRSKHPMFESWPEIATTDEAQVERWWKQTPDANVGIATGRKSRVFAMDIDPRHAGDITFDLLVAKQGKFAETLQQITGTGGWHLFFRYPNIEVRNKVGVFQGIDIRGEGGFVVAPPSVHPDTGKRYEWDGLAELERQPIADAPLWLLEALQVTKPKVEIPVQIPHGTQHFTLVALAGMMRRAGLDAEDIYPSLMKVNERHCERPGPAANIAKIADSMMKYAPADASLYKTATKLWRLTKAKEVEDQKRVDKLMVTTVDGLTIYRSDTPDNQFVIEGLLLNGLTILAGRPKSGKSWCALQLALSVSLGTLFMATKEVATPGLVDYFALEESQQRTALRMRKLLASESILLQNLNVAYSLLPLAGGGMEQLKLMVEKRPPSLIVIDTFLKAVGAPPKENTDLMRTEYREIDMLHKLAQDAKIAIVLVHHTRKAGGAPIDAIAGSTGVTAAADSIWRLDKRETACILDVMGRDIEDQSLALRFSKEPDTFGWSIIGDGESVQRAEEERAVTAFLSVGENPHARPDVIARFLHVTVYEAIQVLEGMRRVGSVNYDGHGRYYLSKSGATVN